MIYEYKGIEYELPDDITDEQAFALIQAEAGDLQPQQVPMTDEQLRERMVLPQQQQQQPVISEPPGFRQNQQAWEQSGRSTPIGQTANAMGSGAMGIMQGATGGLSKKAFEANRARGGYNPLQESEAGLQEYEQAAGLNKPSYTIGELVGGIYTGRQLGGLIGKSGAVKSATGAISKIPKIGGAAGKAAGFAARSTAEGLPWISKAGIEEGVGGAAKETGINIAADALLGWIGKGVRAGIEQVIPMTTRVSKEALEMYSTKEGKELIRKFAGEGEALSDYVIENLDNFDDFLPDYQLVENALSKMPPVKKSLVTKRINDLKFEKPIGVEKSINKEIEQIANDINEFYPADISSGTIPALDYKNIVKSLDNGLIGKWGKASDLLSSKLKAFRHEGKVDLEALALKSGNTEYIYLMGEISGKLQAKQAILSKIGYPSNQFTQVERMERFLGSLTHKKKSGSRRLTDELGKIFGDDIKAKAEAVNYARQLGIDPGKKYPAWFNTIFMRSLVGGISGGASLGLLGGLLGSGGSMIPGAALGIGAGAAATSPRVGSMIYGGAKNVNINPREVAKLRYTIGDLMK